MMHNSIQLNKQGEAFCLYHDHQQLLSNVIVIQRQRNRIPPLLKQTNQMSLWTEVLDKIAQQNGILYWGREIENGRSYGILRFNTSNLKPKHFIAISQAIQMGPHLLQEISIQFSSSFPPSKQDDYENQFLPGGLHYKYLSWLDQLLPPICNPYSDKRMTTATNFGGGQRQSSSDLRPKDMEVRGPKKLDDKAEQNYFKSLQKLVECIAEQADKMINLRLIAFYNMNFSKLMGPTLLKIMMQGLVKSAVMHFLLEGIIFKNCFLEENASTVIKAVKECKSIRLLALVEVGMPNQCGNDVQDAILSHKNYRDDKIWEKALKNEKITFNRSNSSKNNLNKSQSLSRSRGLKQSARQNSPTSSQQVKWPKVVIERQEKTEDKAPKKKGALKEAMKEKDELKRSKAAMKKIEFTQEELLKLRIRSELKGLSYLDLSYNDLDNEFLEKMCNSLKDDTYIHSLEFTGNDFDLKVKTLRLGELLFEPNYGEEVDWNKIEHTHATKSEQLANPRLANQKQLTDRLFTPPFAKKQEKLTSSSRKIPHSMEQIVSKTPQLNKNQQIYLPIEVAIQKDIIEKLDHFQTLDNFQKFILEHIRPNYMSDTNNRLTTIQLMQNYCSSAAELEELQALNAHPLVELLLNNCHIIYLSLDQKTNYALQKFVQLRLKLNKQCMQEVLMNYCGRQLTQIEKEEVELSMQQNLQNIEAMADKLDKGIRVSQIRSQSRQTTQMRQMQEQYGKAVVDDLFKQHEKLTSGDKNRPNKLKTKEEVINEIRDGINQKKYIIKGVNEKVVTEDDKKKLVTNKKKKQEEKQIKSSQTQRSKSRQHQVKTTTSIIQSKARSASNPKQQQQKVAKLLSRPRTPPPADKVSQDNKQIVQDQKKIDELLQQIQQQKQEIQKLKSKVKTETSKQTDIEQKKEINEHLEIKKQKTKLSNNTSDVSSIIFNQILDQAYKFLMTKAGNNRDDAITLFNTYQPQILDCCENTMNLLQQGKLRENDIYSFLNKNISLE